MSTAPQAGDIVRVSDPATHWWTAQGIFDPGGGRLGQVIMGTGTLRVHDGWTVKIVEPVPIDCPWPLGSAVIVNGREPGVVHEWGWSFGDQAWQIKVRLDSGMWMTTTQLSRVAGADS